MKLQLINEFNFCGRQYSLPFKYLDIRMTASKLTLVDIQLPVDRITLKFELGKVDMSPTLQELH